MIITCAICKQAIKEGQKSVRYHGRYLHSDCYTTTPNKILLEKIEGFNNEQVIK
jgi:hypothetical protein